MNPDGNRKANRMTHHIAAAPELLPLPWDGVGIPQSSAGARRGLARISVVTTRAALRAAGAPPHIAAALRSRLRLITDHEAER